MCELAGGKPSSLYIRLYRARSYKREREGRGLGGDRGDDGVVASFG